MTISTDAEPIASDAPPARTGSGAVTTVPPGTVRRPRVGAGADLIALAALSLLTLALFRDHVFQHATFIGDFDRLHTSLAFLRGEVADLRGGRLSAWDDRLFLGTERYSFPPMHPNPLVYLAALVPVPSLFYAAGLLSWGTLTAAAWAAYAFIRQSCDARLFACCGAALYVCSTTALINVVQFDMATATLIYTPLVLLLVRGATRRNAALTFGGCVAVLAAAFWWTSLAFMYTVPLFAAYAAYRSAVTRSRYPLLVLAAAGLAAAAVALPRFVAVWEGLSLIHRSSPVPPDNFEALYAYQNITPREFWRWFDDGIFGRFQGEATALGNNVNLHEGMQFYTSSLTPFLIVAGLALFAHRRRIWVTGDGVFHLLVVAAVLAVVVLPPARYLVYLAYLQLDFTHARATIAGILSACTLVALLTRAVGEAPRHRGADDPGRNAGLRIGVAGLVIALLLGVTIDALAARGQPVKINLGEPPSHWAWALPRLLATGTLRVTPATPEDLTATTVGPGAVQLRWHDVPGDEGYRVDVRGGPHREFAELGGTGADVTEYRASGLAANEPYAFRVRACSGPYCSAFSDVATATPAASNVGSSDTGSPASIPPAPPPRVTWVSSPAVARILWSSVALAGLLAALAVVRRRPPARRLVGTTLAFLMVYQAFTYADFQLAGPHTRRNVVPFENGLVMAEPGEYVPPGASAVAAIRAQLEADAYRTAFVCDPTEVPFACANLVSALWDVRTVNGYSVGLPRRLAAIPWSRDVQGYRSIAFLSPEALPWRLLALLNVKYAVLVEGDLYTGVALRCAPACDPSALSASVLENPFPVAPRAFFPSAVEHAGSEQAAAGMLFPLSLGGQPAFDVTERSVVEGLAGPFDQGAGGDVRATYSPDRVTVQVDPADRPRLLVLNEAYAPRWRAFAGGAELDVLPTNLVMRGVVVPAGAAEVELRYVPFTSTPTALALLAGGLAATLGLGWGFRRLGARARHA